MIRACQQDDIDTIYEIINDSARAYKGHIPDDRYHEPYMPMDQLLAEIAGGVVFYGVEEDGRLVAVMGFQDKGPVTLIRHAYTRTERRGRGIGARLLGHLLGKADAPVLIGTWRDAEWAIRFYEKHGFTLVSEEEKEMLLREYWSVPERQVETSVVLANELYQRGGVSDEKEEGTGGLPFLYNSAIIVALSNLVTSQHSSLTQDGPARAAWLNIPAHNRDVRASRRLGGFCCSLVRRSSPVVHKVTRRGSRS